LECVKEKDRRKEDIVLAGADRVEFLTIFDEEGLTAYFVLQSEQPPWNTL